MNPIRLSVERPYITAVAVILAVLFSLLALRRIPVQLKPTTDVPRITINTNFRGASAVEVEEQLTREIEEVLQEVEGLIELSSTSSEGRSVVTLEFEYGTDTQLSVVDVINKLSRIPSLPAEADEPQVEVAAQADGDQVMWISMRSSYDDNRVRRYVIDEIEARLKRVPGVSRLLVVGGAEREIQVRVDPDVLLGRGIRFAQLAQALQRGNLNVRGGTVEEGVTQLAVRTVGRAFVARDLEQLVVLETPGGAVRLRDVASVVDGYEESTGFVSINGTPGVAIGVSRKAGFNVVELIEALDATCADLNETFANRGLDLVLEPVYRETTYIRDALDFVYGNLYLGAALSVLVLLVFLRSLRSVLIIAIAIPISLVCVFLVMQAAGRTLNVISLAGIAFASGMVVDNAIVVLENIFRHLQGGRRLREAAIEGGREVWGGVLASTLTTIAVFVPILLQQDEASELFTDIALAISAAVSISLVVALTLVPVLATLILRDDSESARQAGHTLDSKNVPLGAFGRWYERTMQRVGASRAWPAKLGAVFAMAAASAAALAIMPAAEYLPAGNRNLLMFFADPIPGTRPEAVRDNFKPLEDFILAQPETQSAFAVTGPFFNGGGVILKEQHSSGKVLADYHARLWGPALSLAGFQFVVPVRSSLFEQSSKEFEVELSGPDFATLERASAELLERLQAVEGVQSTRSTLVTGRPELRVEIDAERAMDAGLTVGEIGEVVETALAGRRLTTLIDAGRDVDVNLLVPPERVRSAQDLESLRFLDGAGRPIALASVARVVRTTGPQSVRRLERERNVLVTVNISDATPLEQAVEDVENEVFPPLVAQLGPAYTLRVGGSADKLRATLAALSSGFGLSILITYLLLVALFSSWFAPLVILTSVPLALAGGLLGISFAHWYSDGQAGFDVIAMLGFIILAGLVVNNAILIVHQAGNFRAEGMHERAALARSASTRLRPILMTVITTVVGMIPLALGGGAGSELYQGLGAILVGGLVVSTFFTLFLVPLLVSIGHDWREAWSARKVPARVQ